MHASTWVSAGLGVALGGFGRRGGWGLWWCLWWGLGARVGGEGSDVVMEFVYSAPTASSTLTKPRQATESKPEARFCGFKSTRGARRSDSSHSPIPRDETWVSKSPPGEIPKFGAGGEILSQPRF